MSQKRGKIENDSLWLDKLTALEKNFLILSENSFIVTNVTQGPHDYPHHGECRDTFPCATWHWNYSGTIWRSVISVDYQPKQAKEHVQRKKKKKRGISRWTLVAGEVTKMMQRNLSLQRCQITIYLECMQQEHTPHILPTPYYTTQWIYLESK